MTQEIIAEVKERLPANSKQALIGFLVLLLGLMIYLFFRPPGSTYIHDKILPSIHSSVLPFVGKSYFHSFPSFLHSMAFSLIGMGLFCVKHKSRALMTVSVVSVSIFFEMGQKFKGIYIYFIPELFNKIAVLDNTSNYFRYGTFDMNDVVATLLGGVLAWVVATKY